MRNKQLARRYTHRGVHCFDIRDGTNPNRKTAYKPFRVLLQNELKWAAIPGIFAGIAKDSPH